MKHRQRIGICDDSEEDRAALRALLEERLRLGEEAFEILAYSSGESLLMAMEEDHVSFDLLFLDIYMSGISGMDTARKIRGVDRAVALVFLTTSPDFALESYEVFAFDYLVKSMDSRSVWKKRLDGVLNRFFTERIPRMKESLLTLDRKKGTRVAYGDVTYMESRGHTVTVFRGAYEPVIVYGRLSDIESELAGRRNFLRCHQSYIVNLDYVRTMENDFILLDETAVPVRMRERKRMREIYYEYFIENTL